MDGPRTEQRFIHSARPTRATPSGEPLTVFQMMTSRASRSPLGKEGRKRGGEARRRKPEDFLQRRRRREHSDAPCKARAGPAGAFANQNIAASLSSASVLSIGPETPRATEAVLCCGVPSHSLAFLPFQLSLCSSFNNFFFAPPLRSSFHSDASSVR